MVVLDILQRMAIDEHLRHGGCAEGSCECFRG